MHFYEQVNRDSITRNPTSHLKCLPKPVKSLLQREEEYYTEAEVSEFFKQEMHPRYRLAFTGLFLTGMRYEELATLTWEFVDLDKKNDAGSVRGRILKPRRCSERDIPISDRLFVELQKISVSEEK